jgi:hypothetical protein
MGTADGVIGAMQKIVDHGSEDTHWNWVVLAEGYQQGELGKFDTDFNALRGYLATILTTGSFAESGCWERINLYKLPIASTDSGADNDSEAGCGTPVLKRTFLDARYCYDGITQRWLVVDNGLAHITVSQRLPQYHQIIVLVNGLRSGGSGGPGGNCTVVATRPGVEWWHRAMHEIGHTAFSLGDEYHDIPGPPPNASPIVYPNVATAAEVAAKSKWIPDPRFPAPTEVNTECGHTPVESVFEILGSTVGAFEGAGRYTCDLYRPQLDCRMCTNASSMPFCAVCTARIKQVLGS